MDQNIHQNKRALKLIEKFGCRYNCDKEHKYHSIKDGCVVLHPGSSDLERSWPDSHWVELARLLSIRFNVSVVKTKGSSNLVSKLKFENLDFIHSLVIDKKFMNDIEDYGTFYIFHNTNSKFNSILRNSCYF